MIRMKVTILTLTSIAFGMLAAGSNGSSVRCQSPKMEQGIRIKRAGSEAPRTGPAERFSGEVTIDSTIETDAPAHISGARVLFKPGARTAWHTHPLGQVLIVMAGTGRVQRWGDPIDEIRQGDVVWIPPGQKHWHGASSQTSMTHIALLEQLDGTSVTWMEKVTDAEYAAPLRGQTSGASGQIRPRPSQGAIGNFAPKLADLTDEILYGDIWERPELSKRDRSLATVSALIALNRPEQLRSHFLRARENGVTEQELVETITHLAFYTGWPNAITAITVAREIFGKR